MTEIVKRWMPVDEISKYLGGRTDAVCRWIDKQAMFAYRVGRLWGFEKVAVNDWVKAGKASEHGKRILTKNE